MARISRGRLLLLAAAVALVELGAATQTWVAASTEAGTSIAGTGSDIVAVVPALCMAVLAVVAASSLAARWSARVLGAVHGLLAVLLAVVILRCAANPLDAISALVSQTTGVAGQDGVRDLVTGVSVTAWLWGTFGGSIVSGVLGVVQIWASGRWTTRSRHEVAARGQVTAEPAETWDSLSRGSDPTMES